MHRLHILFLLILLSLPLSAQHFFGYSQLVSCKTAADSTLLKRQSDLYSGKRSDNKLFYLWVEKPHEYFPALYEAWNYCVTHSPEQYNFYKDGQEMLQYMLQSSTTEADSLKYLDMKMKLYDLRAANIDSINAYVKNVKNKSSKVAIQMRQINEWDLFYVKKNSDSLHAEKLYEKYLPVISSLNEALARGEDAGGDLQPSDLNRFFYTSGSHYAHVYYIANNAEGRKSLEDAAIAEYNDSVDQQKKLLAAFKDSLNIPDLKTLDRRNPEQVKEYNEKMTLYKEEVAKLNEYIAKQQVRLKNKRSEISSSSNEAVNAVKKVIIDQYEMIKDIVDRQKQSLAKDFEIDPSLSEEEAQAKVDAAIAEICAPYDNLIEYCQQTLEGLRINLGESSLMDLDTKYYDQLASHKDSLQWLNRLRLTCESTIDFDPNDPFYLEVTKYFDACYEQYLKRQSDGQGGQKAAVVQAVNKSYSQGTAAWRAMGSARGNEAKLKLALLACYYFDKAAREDPGNAGKYRKHSSDLRRMAKSEAFMAGIKNGQSLTVNGVTFTVSGL